MNFKEAFSRIEKDEKTLSPRLEQREKIEEFKQKLESSQGEDSLTKIKSRVFDAGILDTLSEALDFLPSESVFVVLEPGKNYQPASLITIRIPWGLHAHQFKALLINLPLDSDKIDISSACFMIPRRDEPIATDVYFSQSLDSKQWKDKDRITAGIADAIWSAGVRTPKSK